MSINKAQIEQLGKLSRLFLTEEEINSLQSDLEKIVNYVDELSKVDTTNIEPMIHVGDTSLRLRKDEIKEVVGTKGLLSSLGYEDGLIKVPKIIE
jgi:aspartyl-tRNA(Asn)/glutamyl-tRNA(Gln) amidotransferase subunit C